MIKASLPLPSASLAPFLALLFLCGFNIEEGPLRLVAAEDTCTVSGCSEWGTVDDAYQQQLKDWQADVTARDNWEWTVVKINSVSGLADADLIGEGDARVEVEALTSAPEPEVDFYNNDRLAKFVFPVQNGNNNPKWYQLGMVMYEQGSTTQLQAKVIDEDAVGISETLLDLPTDLPAEFDVWTEALVEKDGFGLNISMWRSQTPLATPESQSAMGLTQETIELDGVNQAALVHKTKEGNQKAVLYFAGKADTFTHPHVLQMYEERGYDFYSLDPRYCGRMVPLLEDVQYAHWIDNFDVYQEEIQKTIDLIKSKGNYDTLLVHAHSTGALMALNYVLQLQKDDPQSQPFDGYVLNAPFLDWGHVGGDLYEFVLENANLVSGIIENPLEAEGISVFATRFWMLYRFPTDWRTIIQTHTNGQWTVAATKVQDKINDKNKDNPITNKPTFVISSLGDDILKASETQARLAKISSNFTSVLLEYNSHDVTLSFTKELNDDAINEISNWLDWFDAGDTSTAYVGSNNTYSQGQRTLELWLPIAGALASVLVSFLL